MKVGRNHPCPCGSGKKFKKCHGALSKPAWPSPEQIKHTLERARAEARIRETQQGLGKPIIGAKAHGHQLVAVGNKLYYSSTWKTFPDFLGDYIKGVLGPDWGNAEIAKPLAERHTIMQWYDAYCRFQREYIRTPGEVHSAAMPGVVSCFLGLAYSLYLLSHNIELQARLIQRLKDPGNFQGAFYELIVANTLIRAGYTLTLEDETDGETKHCEFAGVSKRTGKKYWVEAKMRAVSGLFGKGPLDGTSDPNPISHLIPHLNAALKKPAKDDRLIFIDLNTEPEKAPSTKAAWIERAAKRLEQYEVRELEPGVRSYVFVTNFAQHRMLDKTPQIFVLPFGLGMPDFNRPGYIRVSEAYRTKQKHRDAHDIGEALTKYPQVPITFDGKLPSESFGRISNRVCIGETYFFNNAGEGGIVGTVTAATVNEAEKKAYIGITDKDGRGQILSQPMSDEELADYRNQPEAYFGRIQHVPKRIESPLELFESFMEAHKSWPREKLLERLMQVPNLGELSKLSTEELCMLYCEMLVASVRPPGALVEPITQPTQEA